MSESLRREVRDDDGTVYGVRVETLGQGGLVSHAVFARSPSGGWGPVVGGFHVRRPQGVVDPASLVVHAVQRDEEPAMQRVARRFLGYGLA